ncbi:MAG: EAL domain-containing protein [Actinomycetes bacterium]
MTNGAEPDSAAARPAGGSWRRYLTTDDTSSEAAYETDLQGVITWVSPTIEALLEWTPDQLVGTHAVDLIHPMDLDRVNAIRANLYAEAREYAQLPCLFRTASGSYRSVTVRARPRTDADQTVIGSTVRLSDTHERDSALRALATLSEANRTLIRVTNEDALLLQMCQAVVSTGQYQFAWYGRPLHNDEQTVRPVAQAGESQGYLDEIKISWGDNPLGRGPTGRSIRLRQTQVSNNHAPDPDFKPWRKAAADRGFNSSISLPVFVDDDLDGALVVYAAEAGAFDAQAEDLLEDLAADLGYGMHRLRDRRALEGTTREAVSASQRLQATLDSQFDPVALMEAVRDDDGHLIELVFAEANAAAIEYNRMPREQLIGARLLDVMPGQAAKVLLQHYFKTIETGEPVILDDFAYRHELVGEERRFDLRATKSGDGVAVTWRDITDRHDEEQRLADSERRFRLLAENSSDVIFMGRDDMTITWASPSARHAFGTDAGAYIGRRASEFIHPDDLASAYEALEESRRTDGSFHSRQRWRCEDGSYSWIDVVGKLLDDDGTGQPGRVVSLRIVDGQVRAEQGLAAREEQYRLLAEHASDIVWQTTSTGQVTWVSPSITPMLGWDHDDVIGMEGLDLIHPDDRAAMTAHTLQSLAARTAEAEIRILDKSGGHRWMALAIRTVEAPEGVTRVISMRDVQDQVLARQRMEFALGHDATTGLPNRSVMIERLREWQGQLERFHSVGVLCLGIDGLSEVNEALGHSAGDLLITTMAARVASALDSAESLGRGAGNELIVVLRNLRTGSDAAAIADKIHASTRGQVEIAGQTVSPTMSIGIVTGGRDSNPEGLLRDGSLALRKAKENGRDRYEFADPGLAIEAQQRLALDAEIRTSLHDGAFQPWYQPVVNLGTGQTVGFEALARWMRPSGAALPVAFLAIAERSSLVIDIDLAIMRQSIAQLAGLPDPLFIAVNVSAATLTRSPYAEHVMSALLLSDVDPGRLHLEVTESMLLNPSEPTTHAIRQLADAGVRWYIDDFGTGYASITSLRDLPMSGLKLDRSFTHGITSRERTSMRLAEALVGLAAGLELDTVAEGVEREDQAEYLRSLGWHHAQGWLYGKAEPTPIY